MAVNMSKGGGDRIEIVGLQRLRSTMKRADRDLQSLESHRKAADTVVRAARPPAVSGRLRSSITGSTSKDRATITAGVPYAGVIHWGNPRRAIRANPFLSVAATSTEPQWIQAYEQEIEKILDTIEGA